MTNHEGHIKLWDELARTSGKDKGEAFDSVFGQAPYPMHGCFACREAMARSDGCDARDRCPHCPIKWTDDERVFKFHCEEPDSPYVIWCETETPAESSDLAALIRDLPWREK